MDGDDDLRTAGGLVVPGEALHWSFSRASGAGGQHVNKTATKVALEVDVAAVRGPASAVERVRAAFPAAVRVSSQDTRSQWRNRVACLEQAAEALDRAARPAPPLRRPSKPTRGSVERRLAGKRHVADKKLGRRAGSSDW